MRTFLRSPLSPTLRLAPVLALLVAACGGEAPPAPSGASPNPSAIVLVRGNAQEGKVGEPLPQRLEVRVTDAEGRGIEDVRVTWEVVVGRGRLDNSRGATAEDRPLFDRTDGGGFSSVSVRPLRVGLLAVTARAEGLEGAPIRFTADVPVLVIQFSGGIRDALSDYPEGFWTGDFRSAETVRIPLGTGVEWYVSSVPDDTTAVHIVSTGSPPGGATFDSGPLGVTQRFLFVPRVRGSWSYEENVSGTTAELTVE